jgi:5-methyltetrahydrofolate--homocysteine methyltransferase
LPHLTRCAKPEERLPVQVQVTLEATGTMLLGTEIGAALATLEMFDVGHHRPELRHRAEGDERRRSAIWARTPRPFRCCPTPGCRRMSADTRCTSFTPQELADYHKQFIAEYGVRIVADAAARLRTSEGGADLRRSRARRAM